MPADIPSLATFEGQARILAEQQSLTLSRVEVKKLAKQLRREYFDDMPSWDPDAVRDTRILGVVTDATPREAFREITANDRAAAQRLGLVSA